ncbi:MAG: EAL domain-containing protein [Nitrosomonadales bacterium]|nr:EAL domain-containing protein [Nitrosomonadales bacterium]
MHRKLLLTNLLATALAFLLGLLIISLGVWQEGHQRAELDGLTRARVIADNSAAGLMFQDKDSVAATLDVLRVDGRVLFAAVYDRDGKLFVGLGASQPAIEPPGKLAMTAAEARFSGGYLDVWAPVSIKGESSGMLLIREDMSALYLHIARLVGIVLLSSLISGGLATLLVYRMLQRVISPLSGLSLLMQQVSQKGDYSSRAEVSSRDEVGELAESFNLMLDQIERNNIALSCELNQRRDAEIKLDRLAHYDNVTQLTNRHYFEHRLHTLLREMSTRGERAALMFIDLDNFKDVNDTYGHHIGDQLLRTVGARMAQSLRSEDEVSRLGGDEFAVLLTRISELAQVEVVASKILKLIAQPVFIEGHEIFVGVSIGTVMLPDDTIDFNCALRYADMAMYHAKHLGRNNHQFYRRELSEEQGQRLLLESNLRRALERDEFEVFFQPIHSLAEGRALLGAEALIRWRHPELGLVPPADFIPMAEESGLIVRIGEWVLRTACQEAMRWQGVGASGKYFVAVNLSPCQLADAELIARVKSALSDSGLPPELLELELTESVLADQSEGSVQKLIQTAEMGVQLVLDDFGTGYSSLSYLKHFPITKLKIDRSFVSELPDDLDDRSICEAIVGLSKSLQVTVLAEGIETLEQAELLQRIGCQEAQGFYFNRPMPAEAFRQLLGQDGNG